MNDEQAMTDTGAYPAYDAGNVSSTLVVEQIEVLREKRYGSTEFDSHLIDRQDTFFARHLLTAAAQVQW